MFSLGFENLKLTLWFNSLSAFSPSFICSLVSFSFFGFGGGFFVGFVSSSSSGIVSSSSSGIISSSSGITYSS